MQRQRQHEQPAEQQDEKQHAEHHARSDIFLFVRHTMTLLSGGSMPEADPADERCPLNRGSNNQPFFRTHLPRSHRVSFQAVADTLVLLTCLWRTCFLSSRRS